MKKKSFKLSLILSFVAMIGLVACKSNEPTNVTDVTVDPTTLTLDVGGTAELTATVAPENAANKNVTWASSDTAVATVDANGKVKAIKVGTATITVTTEDGNKTATCQVVVVQRGVLLEDFTATWCGPCFWGMKNIQKVLGKFKSGQAILVCHHLQDDFAVKESNPLAIAYNLQGYPSCMLNRTKVSGSTILFHPAALTADMIKKQLETNTSVLIGINTSYNESSKELKVEVEGNLLSDLPKARLNVYLVQDSIIAYQNGGTNSYAHRNALRKVLSTDGAWGDKLGVSVGKFSKTYTYTMPDKIGKFATDLKKMYVVAFVAEHHSTTDMKDNIVHNATIKKIK